MAVTIKDVARETNLAISTISKYMNGGSVREKKPYTDRKSHREAGIFPQQCRQRTADLPVLRGGGDYGSYTKSPCGRDSQ